MSSLYVLKGFPQTFNTFLRYSVGGICLGYYTDEVVIECLYYRQELVDHHLVIFTEMPKQVDENEPVKPTVRVVADGDERAIEYRLQVFQSMHLVTQIQVF